MLPLTTDLLLYGYANGYFPMADSAGGEIRWYSPDPRALIPLDGRFRTSRSLRRAVERELFEVTVDTAFGDVISACAERRDDEGGTWISGEIAQAYAELHAEGFAHSVECRQDGVLVGGLYGVALGGAFFGESMFHRARDASKVALVHLVDRLRAGGFVILDTQFITDHLAQFGAYEVSREEYLGRLKRAMNAKGRWDAIDDL